MHADAPSPLPPIPFGLAPIRFPFPALAALAGRLPLGGGREVALASLTVARLAQSAIGRDALTIADRAARANAAKVWLASLALPAATRGAFARVIESTAAPASNAAVALRALIGAASGHLDGPSVAELERLARMLSEAE